MQKSTVGRLWHRFVAPYVSLTRSGRLGYELFLPRIGSYDLKGSPLSWTKVVAMRDALTKFPDASYFWFLDQDAFIMNPHLTVQDHLMNTAKLEAAMLKDLPVVPPDSIIKTFSHLRGQDVDLVITQDKDGLSVGSFILRNTDWAIFFLETWFDPLYRSYNFQKAETHALVSCHDWLLWGGTVETYQSLQEHIVQWHPTILSKLAIVPQKTINAYSNMDHGLLYEKGDIAVRFVDCLKTSSGPSCETDAHRFIQQWRNEYSR